MSTIYDYKKTRAVVIERPYEVRLREITLTEPKRMPISRGRITAVFPAERI